MKATFLMTAILMIAASMITSSAHAGLARFNSAEFNDVIRESQEAEKELRKDLRQDAGFRAAERRKAGLREVSVSDNGGAVNVPSAIFKNGKKKASIQQKKAVESRDYDRLTQELNDTY